MILQRALTVPLGLTPSDNSAKPFERFGASRPRSLLPYTASQTAGHAEAVLREHQISCQVRDPFPASSPMGSGPSCSEARGGWGSRSPDFKLGTRLPGKIEKQRCSGGLAVVWGEKGWGLSVLLLLQPGFGPRAELLKLTWEMCSQGDGGTVPSAVQRAEQTASPSRKWLFSRRGYIEDKPKLESKSLSLKIHWGLEKRKENKKGSSRF